ncbi:hypothetical protein [Roseateles sp. P5_D6]
MAAILDTLRPGDVISSDLLNRIIALLNEHDAAIGGAGPSNQLITGFDPPLQQNAGRTLRVFGSFDFPLGTNLLSIDGVPISPAAFQAGSNNAQLVVTIPGSIPVPSASREVIVRVSNSQGTSERPYTLLPVIAGLPDPVISNAVDAASGQLILRSGQNARITGIQFANPAANNLVRLIFNTGPGQTAFPPNAGGSLPIDPASVINNAPTESVLLVTMPPNLSAVIASVGGTSQATIEITVPGANNVDTQNVTIRRMV